MANLLVFIAFAFVNVPNCIQAQVIITPQEDYNAPLDREVVVMFNCTGTAQITEWLVNDTIPVLGSDPANRGVMISPVQMTGPGIFSTFLSIPATIDNDMSAIRCRVIEVNGDQAMVFNSKLIYFNIQGLLGPPPNPTLSETQDGLRRVLSWDAPATLDITDIDPDIQSYQVCYNLTSSNYNLICLNVSSLERREFKFLNVRVPLLFAVTATNVVGMGEPSSIVYQPSACDIQGIRLIVHMISYKNTLYYLY